VRGEPIVCSPQDAYRCFMRTDMDLVVLEDALVWKSEQPATNGSRNGNLEYELD
jgi:carbamoyltransferase